MILNLPHITVLIIIIILRNAALLALGGIAVGLGLAYNQFEKESEENSNEGYSNLVFAAEVIIIALDY